MDMIGCDSLTAYNKETKKHKAFFMEYFVFKPTLEKMKQH